MTTTNEGSNDEMSSTARDREGATTTTTARRPCRGLLRAFGSGAPALARARLPLALFLAASLAALTYLIAASPPHATAQDGTCSNADIRERQSAQHLPDCRAYELVSLPNSRGLPPVATNWADMRNVFTTPLISSAGDSVMYQSIAGGLPGLGSNGLNDRYLATRTEERWETEVIGPVSAESEQPVPGGMSPDNTHYFVETGTGAGTNPDAGSLVVPGAGGTTYLHSPDGTFDLLGQGSLGNDAQTGGHYISPAAEHVLFSNGLLRGLGTQLLLQLEPSAAPTGTLSIYDRAPDGQTHVVSLLPGDVQLPDGEHAWYRGANADGNLVAFIVDEEVTGMDPLAGPLYVRVDNQETQVVTASDSNSFAGIFNGHVFYADSISNDEFSQTPGDLFSFDTSTQTTTQITSTGDALFVNVADDGSRVYFVSESQIGGEGAVGEPNLYLWERDGGVTTFVATLTSSDISGTHQPFHPQANVAGWAQAATAPSNRVRGTANATSRATADGSILVFESAAQLTSHDNAGHAQVYRYNANTGASPECISCVGGGPATGTARFQTLAHSADRNRPLASMHPTASLSEDGQTVVFEAEDDLLPRDRNGEIDIYRWTEGDGLALISTGRAPADSYLYAVTPDVSGIAFVTPQDLVPQTQNGGTRALYIARVNGGLASQHVTDQGPDDCTGDECQGDPSTGPSDKDPASDGVVLPGDPAADERRANTRRCERLKARGDRHAKKVRQLKRKARRAQGKRVRRLRKRARGHRRKATSLRKRARRCARRSQ